MNHLTKEYVTKLKDSLLLINAVVIIYNASLFLLSTKYISVHYYARDFLNKVSYITRTPQNIFFESIRFLIKSIEKSPKSGFYFCGNYVKNGG